jgi:5,10-methylene-tetrahydrofolate dehydrogenase/methenyl tetrahydrofolate cyclohydrolase
MLLLDGKKRSQEIANFLSKEISLLHAKPKLVIIITTDDIASAVYTKRKKEYADKIGALCEIRDFSKLNSDSITSKLKDLVCDNLVNGIILQLPLRKDLDFDILIKLVP